MYSREYTGTDRGLLGCGVCLVGFAVVLTWLSSQFPYGSNMAGRPILPLVGLLMAAALVYFVAVYLVPRTTPTRRLAYGIFAVGALMRVVVCFSQPILEDDFYRYLWDGAVTASGHNPYSVAPATIQARDESALPALRSLGEEAGVVLHRVNHPDLGTVYPPVAQAFFAVAHALTPWQLAGLRILYYAIDCAVFGLLILLLRELGRSPLYALIYWWNPLAIKEVYNSAHMDLLLVPLILASVLLCLRGRAMWSMAPLACAASVKLWPLLLALPLAATTAKQPRRVLAALVVFVILAVVLLGPALTALSLGEKSGFLAYGARWEMNDALFMVFPWLARTGATLAGQDLSPGTAHRLGKLIAMILLAGFVLWATWCNASRARSGATYFPDASIQQKQDLCRGLQWIAATLFLLSPTQFPWYFLWLLPFLALTANRALLGLTLVLPLYYLRFYFDAQGNVDFFHYRVVWVEYTPIWALLLYDAVRRPTNKRPVSAQAIPEVQ